MIRHRLPEIAWGGCLALTPLVFAADALQPGDLARRLWFQGLLVAAALFLPRTLIGARTKAVYAMAALAVWVLLGPLWCGDRGSALLSLFHWIVAAQFLLLGTILSPSLRRASVIGLALAGGIAALIGTLQARGYPPAYFPQIFAPASSFMNRNQGAEVVAAAVPLGLVATLMVRTRAAATGLSLLHGFCLFYVVAARSRACWLSLAVSTLAALVLAWRHPGLRAALRTVSIREATTRMLPGLFVLFLVFPGPGERGRTGRAALGDELYSLGTAGIPADESVDTVAVRLALLCNTLALAADHPWGVGPGQFGRIYPAYHDRIRATPTFSLTVEPEYAHNDPLQWLAELGLPGALLLLVVIGSVAGVLRRDSARAPRDVALLELAPLWLVVQLGLNSLFSFPLHMPMTAMMFWLCCGMCLPAARPPARRPGDGTRLTGAVILAFNLGLGAVYAVGLRANVERATALRAMHRGAWATALDRGATALARYPLDWRAMDELVSIAASKPRPDAQDVDLAEAFCRRRPYSANAWFRLAHIQARLGRTADARSALARAEALLGPDPEFDALRKLMHALDASAAQKP